MRFSTLIRSMGTVLLLCALGVIVSIYELNSSYRLTQTALEHQAEFKQLGLEIADASDYLTNEARLYTIYGDKKHYDNYWKEVNETKTRDKAVMRLKELGAPPESLDLIDVAKKNSDALIKTEEASMQAVAQKDFEKARQLMFDKNYDQNKAVIMEPLQQFEDIVNAFAERATDTQEDKTNTLMTLTTVLILLLSMLLLGTFVILFRKSRKLVSVANQIAHTENDLTVRLPESGRDEVTQITTAFNRMMTNFENLIQQIHQASHQTATSAEQLQASSEQTTEATERIVLAVQEIAQGTDRQVQTVENGHNILSEINSTLIQITTSSQTVSDKVNQASVTARVGNTAIQTAVDQMNSIHVTIRQLSAVIRELGQRSQNIDQIVQVITEIAQQTNLLSLNAAIEAARAGEHGRGFAVVADEVRMLAEQSSSSAQQIAAYISVIQSEIDKAVQSMEVGNQEVLVGLDVVSQAGDSFAAIQHSVEDIDLHMQEVSKSTRGLTESSVLSSAIEAISEVAFGNANQTQFVSASTEEQLATMEEIGASSNSLAEMSEHLQQLVGRFKVK